MEITKIFLSIAIITISVFFLLELENQNTKVSLAIDESKTFLTYNNPKLNFSQFFDIWV